jgi:hypothetical protein
MGALPDLGLWGIIRKDRTDGDGMMLSAILGMLYRKLTRSLALYCICLLFVVISTSTAQGPYDIVVEGDFANSYEFSWAMDSQRLVFINNDLRSSYEHAVTLSEPAWQEYNVITQSLSNGSLTWPLQPTLSSAEISIFQPHEFILAAPNNRLLALVSEDTHSLVIANRDMLTVAETSIHVSLPNFVGAMPSGAYWSADSTSFVYLGGAELVPEPALFYVHVPDPSNLAITTVTFFDNVMIGNHAYMMGGEIETSDRLFDLSTDGTHILMSARRYSDTGIPQRSELVVWFPNNTPESYIVDVVDVEQICNASFSPHNDDEIVILLSNGRLLHYNVETLRVKMLPVTLDGIQTCRETGSQVHTLFSPDGTWLAILNQTTGILRFIDLTRVVAEAP